MQTCWSEQCTSNMAWLWFSFPAPLNLYKSLNRASSALCRVNKFAEPCLRLWRFQTLLLEVYQYCTSPVSFAKFTLKWHLDVFFTHCLLLFRGGIKAFLQQLQLYFCYRGWGDLDLTPLLSWILRVYNTREYRAAHFRSWSSHRMSWWTELNIRETDCRLLNGIHEQVYWEMYKSNPLILIFNHFLLYLNIIQRCSSP